MTQREMIGFDCIQEIKTVLSDFSPRTVFLVVDKTSYEISGARKKLEPLLRNYRIERCEDCSPNPKIEDVEKGIERFKRAEPDVTIAVGGGSVIDTAKLIDFFGSNNFNPRAYLEKGETVDREGKPLIALPTTSGTGSESTHFAVVYLGRTKYSVAHERILPDVAIVDPWLTTSLPPYTSAASGMDALSQAVESYWSIHASRESRTFARRALERILPNIRAAVNEPTPQARLAMAEGAHLAGKAINLTKTTAPHAISYPITSHFGVAHGHAVALSLSSILEFNGDVREDDVLDAKGRLHVQKTMQELSVLFEARTIAETRKVMDELMRDIGLETRLGRLGLRKEDIETIVANGFNPDRVKNNPRRLTKEALREILSSIY